MNAAIINSVPANTGDELLLLSAIRLLDRVGFRVCSVHSNQSAIASRLIPELPHEHDLDCALAADWVAGNPSAKGILLRVARKIRPSLEFSLMKIMRGNNYHRALSKLLQAEWVFSSGGGYLNCRYGFERRVWAFEEILKLGKRIVLLPQSIGPFAQGNDFQRLLAVLEACELILLRDDVSIDHLKSIGYKGQNMFRLPDLGLLSGQWARKDTVMMPSNIRRRILFNAREWRYRISTEQLITKFSKLVYTLLQSCEVEIVFASTCQGVTGYIDDSKIAIVIKRALPPSMQERFAIFDGHLSSNAYFDLARTCDCYIGMRLHGAIIAMHAGLPALAICYEEKTEEIFRELGLSVWCLDLMLPADDWIKTAKIFIENLHSNAQRVGTALGNKSFDFESVASRLSELLHLKCRNRIDEQALAL